MEQLLAGQLLAGADDLGDAAISHAEPPDLAALALEVEAQLRAVDVDVAVLEGGQAIALVLLGVFVAADPDEGRLQKIDDGGENLLTRQAAQSQMLSDLLADIRQALGEVQHVMVLGALADLPKARMITVLFAPSGVAARGLDVPIRFRADPNIGPGRRDGERLDALQGRAHR